MNSNDVKEGTQDGLLVVERDPHLIYFTLYLQSYMYAHDMLNNLIYIGLFQKKSTPPSKALEILAGGGVWT